MNRKQLFALFGLVGLGILLYQRYLNPRCPWCDTALVAVGVGQRLVCPSCGRLG